MHKHDADNKMKEILGTFSIPFSMIFPLIPLLPPSTFGGPLAQLIPLIHHCHATTTQNIRLVRSIHLTTS